MRLQLYGRLAIKDGCSIGEIQERYTTAEIRLWAAWERIYGPITLHERLDVLFAHTELLHAEMNRNKKKQKKPFKLKDFLLKWDRTADKPEVHHTPESLRDKFLNLFK